jgi:hypothetical protein
MFARTLAIGCAVAAGLGCTDASAATLTGRALSGTQPVARAPVVLYRTGSPQPFVLGVASELRRADEAGHGEATPPR